MHNIQISSWSTIKNRIEKENPLPPNIVIDTSDTKISGNKGKLYLNYN